MDFDPQIEGTIAGAVSVKVRRYDDKLGIQCSGSERGLPKTNLLCFDTLHSHYYYWQTLPYILLSCTAYTARHIQSSAHRVLLSFVINIRDSDQPDILRSRSEST